MPHTRHKTKAESDEWKQRSIEVGVRVSNITTNDYRVHRNHTYILVSNIGRGPEWLLRIHKSPR